MCAGVRLTELDLSDNAFGPDGVKGIERLLKSPTCHTLRELKLNNCGMGVGGGKVIRQGRENTFSGNKTEEHILNENCHLVCVDPSRSSDRVP